ncbi:hypothetical protein GCM10010301_07800 [Streptomyces plicatus]|nr:hypothetical protein GCM10010301_07800 [Streptomyces plicatus]
MRRALMCRALMDGRPGPPVDGPDLPAVPLSRRPGNPHPGGTGARQGLTHAARHRHTGVGGCARHVRARVGALSPGSRRARRRRPGTAHHNRTTARAAPSDQDPEPVA